MLSFVIVSVQPSKGNIIMQLTRLKELREQRLLSLRELADISHVPYSAISLLENGKRAPQGRTARKLAAALGVEVAELYEQDPFTASTAQEPAQPINNNKTTTLPRPAKSQVTKKQQQSVGDCWVIDYDGDTFGPFNQADAERLQMKLGGKHKTRIYQATKKAEAWEQHRLFLVKVSRGHDMW